YLPTFVDLSSAHAYVDNEKDFNKAAAEVSVPFKKLEQALERQGSGPFFNGSRYSLVDAAYAPFLQRHLFLERIKKIGQIDKFQRLKAWAEALAARPSTHSFPPAEFEAMYRDMVKRRGKWISQFAGGSQAAAEEAPPPRSHDARPDAADALDDAFQQIAAADGGNPFRGAGEDE